MSEAGFTGERLHEGDPAFALDLARHRAAYEFARPRLEAGALLDFGCGSGHGAALLARAGARVIGLDRVAPDVDQRVAGVAYCRGDLRSPPFAPGRFPTVVSFQVIEHLEDPAPYLEAIAGLLDEGGLALLTTPNRALSDGVNPFHVREYLSDELREVLAARFADVEVLGIGTTPAVRAVLEARSRRIRRILQLDPLGLHRRLPAALVEPLFALGARLVRALGRDASRSATTSWRDFPIGPADEATSLDWLAVCRTPRR